MKNDIKRLDAAERRSAHELRKLQDRVAKIESRLGFDDFLDELANE